MVLVSENAKLPTRSPSSSPERRAPGWVPLPLAPEGPASPENGGPASSLLCRAGKLPL